MWFELQINQYLNNHHHQHICICIYLVYENIQVHPTTYNACQCRVGTHGTALLSCSHFYLTGVKAEQKQHENCKLSIAYIFVQMWLISVRQTVAAF